mmetsp:Transcript_66950/g.131304  ORF Transcript_66950/g.131304 Transcript_66950/m.131304 type:complete len:225 (-) Transcript_66950:307-981(-)
MSQHSGGGLAMSELRSLLLLLLFFPLLSTGGPLRAYSRSSNTRSLSRRSSRACLPLQTDDALVTSSDSIAHLSLADTFAPCCGAPPPLPPAPPAPASRLLNASAAAARIFLLSFGLRVLSLTKQRPTEDLAHSEATASSSRFSSPASSVKQVSNNSSSLALQDNERAGALAVFLFTATASASAPAPAPALPVLASTSACFSSSCPLSSKDGAGCIASVRARASQ